MAMIDFKAILQSILDTYHSGTEGSEVLSGIAERIEAGKATYAEVYRAALEHGRILTGSLKRFLPAALEEAAKNLSPELAEAVIRPSMVAGAKDIGKLAAQVQTALNQTAGIGIGFIEPKPNQDQIRGIIEGLCKAESYEAGEEAFLNRVGNYLEGYVDDCVHDNAKFQYQAGLSPTIERRAVANCCKWCSALAGVYPYDKVSDTGNDVFRRHRNCHCQVLFNPGNGSKKRQDVYSKRWADTFDNELRERQINYNGEKEFQHDYKRINARKIKNYSENNLYIDKNLNLSPREIRSINRQITQAKELHGITNSCKSPFVIIPDSRNLASYNPRTDTFFVNAKMGKDREVLKLQRGYACPNDRRSTMVHELFHWRDAERYRANIGQILDASPSSDYTMYQNAEARKGLIEAGINLEDYESLRKNISDYALKESLDNDYEEAYTEFRTRLLIEGGAVR